MLRTTAVACSTEPALQPWPERKHRCGRAGLRAANAAAPRRAASLALETLSLAATRVARPLLSSSRTQGMAAPCGTRTRPCRTTKTWCLWRWATTAPRSSTQARPTPCSFVCSSIRVFGRVYVCVCACVRACVRARACAHGWRGWHAWRALRAQRVQSAPVPLAWGAGVQGAGCHGLVRECVADSKRVCAGLVPGPGVRSNRVVVLNAMAQNGTSLFYADDSLSS